MDCKACVALGVCDATHCPLIAHRCEATIRRLEAQSLKAIPSLAGCVPPCLRSLKFISGVRSASGPAFTNSKHCSAVAAFQKSGATATNTKGEADFVRSKGPTGAKRKLRAKLHFPAPTNEEAHLANAFRAHKYLQGKGKRFKDDELSEGVKSMRKAQALLDDDSASDGE